MDCPNGHGAMRKSSLATEWKLKGANVEALVCDSCHGMWVANSADAAKAVMKKVRGALYARGSA